MEEIKYLCDAIKQKLSELGMAEFVLYADDFWGDIEEDDGIDVSEYVGDAAENLEWFFNIQNSYNGYSSICLYARKIKIKDNKLLFDVCEEYEDLDGGWEERGFYEDQSIEDLLRICQEEYVVKCLKGILESAFESECYKVIELNRMRLQK